MDDLARSASVSLMDSLIFDLSSEQKDHLRRTSALFLTTEDIEGPRNMMLLLYTQFHDFIVQIGNQIIETKRNRSEVSTTENIVHDRKFSGLSSMSPGTLSSSCAANVEVSATAIEDASKCTDVTCIISHAGVGTGGSAVSNPNPIPQRQLKDSPSDPEFIDRFLITQQKSEEIITKCFKSNPVFFEVFCLISCLQ